MFCKNCGSQLIDNASFCPNCGSPVDDRQQANNHQQSNNNYQSSQQPDNGYQPYQQQYNDCRQFGQPGGAYPPPYPPDYNPYMAPAMPMKWFKFLIYFALFAGAILNFIDGIMILSGAQYGEDVELVYLAFGNLKTLDTVIGVCVMAFAAFGIYTRFRLSGYYKNGPAMLITMYALIMVINLAYIIGVYCILPSEVTELIDLSSTLFSFAADIVMIIINSVYFKKRAHLFTR